jgi:hypothetical protein
MNRRHSRVHRGVALLVLLATAAAVAGCDWKIDAQTFRVADAQEESIFSDGDEPYLAVIQFRVKPGVAGSTSVHYLGNLSELHSGAEDGDVFGIPDAMGRAHFPDVTPVGLTDIANGGSPEIVGVITVAMESDASTWGAVNGLMGDVASELDNQLRTVIETLTFNDIITPGAAADRLEQVAADVEASATPSFWRGIALWFAAFGDPDDVIGFKVLLFAAVDEQLRPIVDDAFGSGLPDTITAKALVAGPVQLTYAGDGATYEVTFDVDLG